MATFGKIGHNLRDTKLAYRRGFRQRNRHVKPEPAPVWVSTNLYDVRWDDESESWTIALKEVGHSNPNPTDYQGKLDAALDLDMLSPGGARICVRRADIGGDAAQLFLTTSRKYLIAEVKSDSPRLSSSSEISRVIHMTLGEAQDWAYIEVQHLGTHTMIIVYGELTVVLTSATETSD